MKISKQLVKARSFTRKMICVKSHYDKALQDFLQNPDDYIRTSEGPFFKKDPKDSSTVVVVKIGARVFLVKRYNKRNFFYALKMRFRRSRAMKSWRNAWQLQRLGIPTVTPVAMLEERVGPLRGRAYFISEYIFGQRGCEYFPQISEKSERLQSVAQTVAVIKQLRAHKIAHPDLQWANIIIKDTNVYVIDLDPVKRYRSRWLFERQHAKNVRHFLVSMKACERSYSEFSRLLAQGAGSA